MFLLYIVLAAVDHFKLFFSSHLVLVDSYCKASYLAANSRPVIFLMLMVSVPRPVGWLLTVMQ